MIQPHRTWKIHDATKLTAFMTCPRGYFYRYILGWEPDQPNIHLAFGEAWHKAMEVLLLQGYSTPALMSAIEAFNASYKKAYPNGNLDLSSAKSCTNILEALTKYCEVYKNDGFPGTENVLYTEVTGTVLIGEERVLHFRLDALINEQRDKKTVYEHKTASRFNRTWSDQWSLSMQIFCYLHALYCHYDTEEVNGVIVNGAAFQKTGVSFLRVPIRKNIDMLEAWLYEINHWIDLIDLYLAAMFEAKPDNTIMETFPKNTTNCTKYFGCPYAGLCSSWANPLLRVHDLPPGFKISWWDPSSVEDRPAKYIMRDGEIRKV